MPLDLGLGIRQEALKFVLRQVWLSSKVSEQPQENGPRLQSPGPRFGSPRGLKGFGELPQADAISKVGRYSHPERERPAPAAEKLALHGVTASTM
jgi:hypothetical protein